MTVVLAVYESDDSILFASDSEWTREQIDRIRKPKLNCHENMPIAWASAGDAQIGTEEFTQWMKAYPIQNKDWDELSEEAAKELARLNGRKRERLALAGEKLCEHDLKKHLAEVMVVGWLNGTPGMYSISYDGAKWDNWSDKGFWAIGSGSAAAVWIWNTLASKHITGLVRQSNLQIMYDSLKLICEGAPGCGLPAEIWRVKANGITSVATLNPPSQIPTLKELGLA